MRSWSIPVLFMGLFVVTGAFQATGYGEQAVQWLAHVGLNLQSPLVLTVVTAVLSNLINNSAAAVLMVKLVDVTHPSTAYVLALRDFARTNPNLVVKGGILGTRLLSTQEVEALADVPPRDELLARLAGGFQGPLVKAAGLFQAFTRNFAYGLKAYVDQRVEGGEVLAADEPATTEPASRRSPHTSPLTME